MSRPVEVKSTKASRCRQAAIEAKSKESEAAGFDKFSPYKSFTPKPKALKHEIVREPPRRVSRRSSADASSSSKTERKLSLNLKKSASSHAVISTVLSEDIGGASSKLPSEINEPEDVVQHEPSVDKDQPLQELSIETSKDLKDDATKEAVKQPQWKDNLRMNVESGTLRPARPVDFPITSRGGTQRDRFPESAESAELRRICADFLDFKRSRVNQQRGMEHDMKRLFPRMDSMLKQVETLSKRISRIPNSPPHDETQLRVENDRLNYLITTSAGVFKQIDMFLATLKEKFQVFTSLATSSNEGIDERLETIVKTLCEKSQS